MLGIRPNLMALILMFNMSEREGGRGCVCLVNCDVFAVIGFKV